MNNGLTTLTAQKQPISHRPTFDVNNPCPNPTCLLTIVYAPSSTTYNERLIHQGRIYDPLPELRTLAAE